MSTPQQRVETDLRASMKASDKERTATLRMLLSEVKNEKIAAGAEVDDTRFAALVRKAIKQRHEAAGQFRAGGREESAAQEEREAELLGTYLPQAVSEEELSAAIRELIAAEGLSGPAAMGRVMKEMLGRYGARADGATVSKLARQALAS
jgi:uncharacterized protein